MVKPLNSTGKVKATHEQGSQTDDATKAFFLMRVRASGWSAVRFVQHFQKVLCGVELSFDGAFPCGPMLSKPMR